ncbi:di-N-acetylchitobiase-like [Tubulanus polymorphus]|uniref:di-N-acetylchitobiase-like n=1 Tax=Tubulanus polymorphus TaxID=672921 RepID=UPI003DA5A069
MINSVRGKVLLSVLLCFIGLWLLLSVSVFSGGEKVVNAEIFKLHLPLSLRWKSKRTADNTCPCQEEYLCKTPSTKHKNEVVIFMLQKDEKYWLKYDWSKVTTAVVFGPGVYNPLMVCHAHSHGAKIVTVANIEKKYLKDAKKRREWVAERVKYVEENFLDGINFDFEDVIERNDNASRQGYNALVQEAQTTFKKINPYYQVTIDVAWWPNCTDDRCYDILQLSKSTDFMFVMSYDEQSQIRGRCIAKANSPIDLTTRGLNEYLKMISASKLVLGVPWYGYNYECIDLSQDNVCKLKRVPFRGVNCSDAVGRQVPYTNIMNLLNTSISGRLWDDQSKSPYFNFKDGKTGKIHQMRYDDVESLRIKYELALMNKLLGVGMWNADCLDYSDTKTARAQRRQMWGAIPYSHSNYQLVQHHTVH